MELLHSRLRLWEVRVRTLMSIVWASSLCIVHQSTINQAVILIREYDRVLWACPVSCDHFWSLSAQLLPASHRLIQCRHFWSCITCGCSTYILISSYFLGYSFPRHMSHQIIIHSFPPYSGYMMHSRCHHYRVCLWETTFKVQFHFLMQYFSQHAPLSFNSPISVFTAMVLTPLVDLNLIKFIDFASGEFDYRFHTHYLW